MPTLEYISVIANLVAAGEVERPRIRRIATGVAMCFFSLQSGLTLDCAVVLSEVVRATVASDSGGLPWAIPPVSPKVVFRWASSASACDLAKSSAPQALSIRLVVFFIGSVSSRGPPLRICFLSHPIRAEGRTSAGMGAESPPARISVGHLDSSLYLAFAFSIAYILHVSY